MDRTRPDALAEDETPSQAAPPEPDVSTATEAGWADDLAAAMTVLDARGVITHMNRRALELYADEGGAALIGRSAFDCHPERARAKLRALLETGRPNHYTIRKRGQKKIIHQLPRLREGRLVGIVEISVPIPDEVPHFDRG